VTFKPGTLPSQWHRSTDTWVWPESIVTASRAATDGALAAIDRCCELMLTDPEDRGVEVIFYPDAGWVVRLSDKVPSGTIHAWWALSVEEESP